MDWSGKPATQPEGGRGARFLRREHGASLPLLGALLIPLLGFVGLATDAARGYVVKTRLHDALDAAGLAGAHEILSSNFEDQIKAYFEANFPPGYLGAEVTLAPPLVTDDTNTLTLVASAEIETTFMRLFGLDTLTISSSTEVTRATTSLDVVLSIDMSGSMGNADGSGGTRIAAARAAAKELVSILFGSSESADLLQVGLVPWNGKVNVTYNGSSYDPGLTTTVPVPNFLNPVTGASQNAVYYANNSPVPLLSSPPANWPGCVYARYADDGDDGNDADTHLAPGSFGDKNWVAWQPNSHNGSGGTAVCLSHGITPLRDKRSEIETAIDELTSPTNVTNIAQGLAWAWRTLSPGAPFDEADPNPKGNHQRAIVLLTDGEQVGRNEDAYDRVFGDGSAAGPGGQDDRLRDLAANIKAQGVRIFAIQFYHDSGPLAALMKEIASGNTAPYYHFAPDGEALQDAFKEVADELSALRISK